MTKIAIIVGEDENDVKAKALTAGLTILTETITPFTALSTFLCPEYEDLDSINTSGSGCIALATRP